MIDGRHPMNKEFTMLPSFQMRRGCLQFWLLLGGIPSNIIGLNIGPIMNWGKFIKYVNIPFVVVISFIRFTINEMKQGKKYTNRRYSSGITGSMGSRWSELKLACL